jgi:hypothetical protein
MGKEAAIAGFCSEIEHHRDAIMAFDGIRQPGAHRRCVRRLGTRDVEEPLREHFEPTARLDLTENIFNSAVYEGYDDIARQRREVSDVWDQFEIEVEQLFEGKDVVVAYTHEHGRGKGAGSRSTGIRRSCSGCTTARSAGSVTT